MHKSSTGRVVARFTKWPPHHGLELEQSRQPCCPGASLLEAFDAAKHGRTRGRVVGWTEESSHLQYATVRLGDGQVAHLLIEKLGETGWDWHVWVRAGRTWARYGLAETTELAREQAERALVGLMRSDTDGNALSAPIASPL